MREENPNKRLEMFSDGVFAIAITLLIIEIKVPALNLMGSTSDVWNATIHLWPSFFALFLSFILIFISWYGHHVLFDALDKASDRFLFASGFFLLTVVILPFPTAFMAEYLNTLYAQPANVFYSFCCLVHNLGWRLLLNSTKKPKQLAKSPEHIQKINEAMRSNRMGTIASVAILVLSWWFPYIALIISLILWSFWIYVSSKIKRKF
ncbi:TMEM175 family protein [Solitalea lacus]|uniref:TMEM175 family protein n=1 Tax=Solitalea lacus TaxID=2911172 RepID=UPI001EDAB63D|nr:TMEM175 family protein [Solitalea lacus]UKJ08312.1 DUF1211 domain-containing protein [Solitalea lacus]